ncbi:hypothetical protein OSB04_004763 [Centaurea solstitialis]|uniref:AB hydrolase-1 domain-containing protein n=1 Tax=Centaurea solstitialis TaxID=347529 RepID=A0AA38TEP3_9ASTR|nr:hypothetical protein OSB04_004763 [Centaurea solstitialis]
MAMAMRHLYIHPIIHYPFIFFFMLSSPSMASLNLLHHLFSFRQIISLKPLYAVINAFPMTSADVILSAYFRYCNLLQTTVYLDDKHQTKLHFLATKHRTRNKHNLVLIHGFGGTAKWQFVLQIAELARDFNVYVPDLVFFGDSYSSNADRSDRFQARCVCDGLRKLGVERFSVYAISYGGFVAYRMAEMHEEMVEKLVIVSSGIVCSSESKSEHLKRLGRNVVDLLVAKTPEDLRALCRISIHRCDFSRWIPDFFLWRFIDIREDLINGICFQIQCCRKEKKELVMELLDEKSDVDLPVLTQETLLVWGEKDVVFPVEWGYELHSNYVEKGSNEKC